MAQFYGTLQGSRGRATRLGTKGSGLDVAARSWEGSISVGLYYDDEAKADRYELRVNEGSNGGGRVIRAGLVRDLVAEVFKADAA